MLEYRVRSIFFVLLKKNKQGGHPCKQTLDLSRITVETVDDGSTMKQINQESQAALSFHISLYIQYVAIWRLTGDAIHVQDAVAQSVVQLPYHTEGCRTEACNVSLGVDVRKQVLYKKKPFTYEGGETFNFFYKQKG